MIWRSAIRQRRIISSRFEEVLHICGQLSLERVMSTLQPRDCTSSYSDARLFSQR